MKCYTSRHFAVLPLDVVHKLLSVENNNNYDLNFQGRTALWDSILLFCHRIKVGYGGIVRGIHLGSSALSILPVLDLETEDWVLVREAAFCLQYDSQRWHQAQRTHQYMLWLCLSVQKLCSTLGIHLIWELWLITLFHAADLLRWIILGTPPPRLMSIDFGLLGFQLISIF